MRDLYKIIDKITQSKRMLRFAVWPSGTCNLVIYQDNVHSQQFGYDGTIDEVEAQVMQDFGHLLVVNSLPRPPGMPRP